MQTIPSSDTEVVELRCVIRSVQYTGVNGWSVCTASLSPRKTCTIVGNLAGVTKGITIVARGRWVEHRSYGVEFAVESFREVVPDSTDGLRTYLASGVIPGVGKATAAKIVNALGADAMKLMDEDIACLSRVKGISDKQRQEIAKAWGDGKERRGAVVALLALGLTSSHANAAYDTLGDTVAAAVKHNPYILTAVEGIGFITADRVARVLGIDSADPQRCRAACLYLMQNAAESGSVFETRSTLRGLVAHLCDISAADVDESLQYLIATAQIVDADGHLYLPGLYRAETSAARRLAVLAATPLPEQIVHVPAKAPEGIVYDIAQQQAIDMAAKSKVMVLTGGPGTGKTTTIRGIISMYRSMGLKILLAAPTGRAARRMAEATGKHAVTLHRLLEADFSSFRRNEDNPLDCDVLIVDESSMIDLRLFNSLLTALPERARLILAGDVDQLPSVGAGNVLADVIQSGVVPVARLDKIFRQADHSHIITNAHRINNGEMPVDDRSKESDFFIIDNVDPESMPQEVVDIVSRRLPASYSYTPADIQVLAPMHGGNAGTDALNELLHDALNPHGTPAGEFRVGDRVMQCVNNYKLMTFNGDIGTVVGSVPAQNSIRVEFDGRVVLYDEQAVGQLKLAYAITIHKSQGAEFPVVIVPLRNSRMLRRNLLYTAVTRARSLCIILAAPDCLMKAVDTRRGDERNTGLTERLRQEAAAIADGMKELEPGAESLKASKNEP